MNIHIAEPILTYVHNGHSFIIEGNKAILDDHALTFTNTVDRLQIYLHTINYIEDFL